MASSRRPANPQGREGASEPFPSFPDQENTQTTSTTVTTTTTVDGRNDPVTTTSTQFPSQPGSAVPPPVVVTDPNDAPVPFSRTTVTVPTAVRRRPIGIRRLPSASNAPAAAEGQDGTPSRSGTGRSRSSSAPQANRLSGGGGSTRLTRQSTRQSALAPVREDATQPAQPQLHDTLEVPGQDSAIERTQAAAGTGRRRNLSNAARSIVSRFSNEDRETPAHEYESEVVDYLDVIDPEVSTLTTLTNVQNSLFVPDLGRWLNRRPTYTLSRAPTRISEQPTEETTPAVTHEPKPAAEPEGEPVSETPTVQRTWSWQRRPPRERSHSISSILTDSHYAVLPHGVNLEGWSEEDKEALDDHVRHMLHSKRSKFKQRMRAFGKYVSKPLGFAVTLYAFLITMFGLAWVLFLIGWIYVGDRQSYLVNIIDNVLVALFAVVGDGLAPFRCVDTYHMIWIAKYHYKTWELRQKKAMPELQDHNDLPQRTDKEADPESAQPEEYEYSVLTPQEQKKLVHHQVKFSKSHSFYKPHETATHYAFPIKLMITAVVLLDFHSIFQVALGTFTWSWSYHSRPAWITTVILCFSISANIAAGVIISIGDRRTRKKDVVSLIARQELTSQAIKKVQKHKDEHTGYAAAGGHAGTGTGRGGNENFEVIREEDAEQARSRSHESSGSFHSSRSHT